MLLRAIMLLMLTPRHRVIATTSETSFIIYGPTHSLHSHIPYCALQVWRVFGLYWSLLSNHVIIAALERELCNAVMGE